MIPSCILYCWKKISSLGLVIWWEASNFLLLVGMVSAALTFWIFFFLWMYSFKFSFRCAVVSFWCTCSFSVYIDNGSFVRKFWLRLEIVSDFHSLPFGWSLYFGVDFIYCFVCFWAVVSLVCFEVFFPSSSFFLPAKIVVIHIKGLSSLPSLFSLCLRESKFHMNFTDDSLHTWHRSVLHNTHWNMSINSNIALCCISL